MKEAGTTKNGLFTFKPAISLSYSLKHGSAVEYSRNSSDIDSSSVKRFFSVISDFISVELIYLVIECQGETLTHYL